MKLTVEIISKETIKPSSPTPNHLRTYKLSLLDQQTASVHVPIILFYSSNCNDENKSDHLKKSLSKILTQFYLLGGRINNNDCIDCNDEGVNFFEARVNGNLSHLLNHPIPYELEKLLPRTDQFYGLGSKVLLSVQLNIFECGGMALGVCISHKAADAWSLSLFLKSWSALAKGNNEILKPKLDLTAVFPPKSNIPSFIPPKENSIHKQLVTKRFVFDPLSIISLRAKCSNNIYVEDPTRVEAVVALIWSCVMRMREDDMKVATTFMAVVATNLRRRMVPPLSDFAFGNVVTTTAMETSAAESSRELQFFVSKLRMAISKIDSDYVKKFQVNDDSLVVGSGEKAIDDDVEVYIFSSWCRFCFYEVDFGWGKPVWTSLSNLNDKNIILLMDTKCGKGIEAWISLNEEDMGRFECDANLISFTNNIHISQV